MTASVVANRRRVLPKKKSYQEYVNERKAALKLTTPQPTPAGNRGFKPVNTPNPGLKNTKQQNLRNPGAAPKIAHPSLIAKALAYLKTSAKSPGSLNN